LIHQNQAPDIDLRRLGRADTQGYRTVRLEASLDPAFAMATASLENMSASSIYRAFLMSPQGWVMGAFDDERLLGIVHIDPSVTPNEFVLWGLYVLLTDRRKGVGEALVASAIDISRSLSGAKLSLQVSSTNQPARRLYQRLGFMGQGQAGSMSAVEPRVSDGLNQPELMVYFFV